MKIYMVSLLHRATINKDEVRVTSIRRYDADVRLTRTSDVDDVLPRTRAVFDVPLE